MKQPCICKRSHAQKSTMWTHNIDRNEKKLDVGKRNYSSEVNHHLKRLDLKQNVRNETSKEKSLVGQLVRHLQIMKVHHFECQQEHLQRIFFFCCMHWQKAAISGRLHTLQHDEAASSGRDHHWINLLYPLVPIYPAWLAYHWPWHKFLLSHVFVLEG